MAYLDFIHSRPSRGIPNSEVFYPQADFAGPLDLDASGNAKNATRVGTTTNRARAMGIPGEDSRAMGYDGSTGYLTFPNTLIKAPLTIEAFVYLNATQTTEKQIIQAFLVGGTNEVSITYGLSSKFLVYCGDGSAGDFFSSNLTPVARQWYYLAVTMDGTTKSLYINAMFDSSNSTHANPNFTSVTQRIGNNSSNIRFINAALGNIIITPSVLPINEIRLTYSALTNGFLGTNILAA